MTRSEALTRAIVARNAGHTIAAMVYEKLAGETATVIPFPRKETC